MRVHHRGAHRPARSSSGGGVPRDHTPEPRRPRERRRERDAVEAAERRVGLDGDGRDGAEVRRGRPEPVRGQRVERARRREEAGENARKVPEQRRARDDELVEQQHGEGVQERGHGEEAEDGDARPRRRGRV